MNIVIEQSLLYDFYGELLTEKQKEMYEDYFFNDLSLGEIAESAGISRQGVHDTIKRCSKQLQKYEDKLHLVDRFMTSQEVLLTINQELENIIKDEQNNTDNIIDKVIELKSIINNLVENL
ncbi:MAG: hypothetical protein K0R15_423 [Clostridiales bacterium]|nr:hypothetical protein [Clostridiales bacterium]